MCVDEGMVPHAPLVLAFLLLQPPQEPEQAQHFPRGTISDFEAKWFGAALARMEEPALPWLGPNVNVYRFTVLPTWGHPVSVRLTLQGGKATIDAKRLGGFGGYDPGGLVDRGSIDLPEAQLEMFLERFRRLGFEALTTQDRVQGTDGSEWILERMDGGRYHVIVRWSPGYDTAKRGLSDFVAVCEWLYRASPLQGDVANKNSVEISKPPGSTR